MNLTLYIFLNMQFQFLHFNLLFPKVNMIIHSFIICILIMIFPFLRVSFINIHNFFLFVNILIIPIILLSLIMIFELTVFKSILNHPFVITHI